MKRTVGSLRDNTVETPEGCWEWQGWRNKEGYGMVRFCGKHSLVHRVMFQLVHPITNIEGKVVRHSCDNPSCCNPAHLSLGTQADNIRDRSERGRDAHPKGELNSKASISASTAWAIKYAYPHLSNRECADLFSVKLQLVYDIRRGKTWSHL